jgi:hypothetical protein
VRRRPTAKIRSSKTVLLILLALQLVIGLQFQVAQAASVRMAMPHEAGATSQPVGAVSQSAGAGAQVDCPTHSAHHATDPAATYALGTHAAGTHSMGTDKHAPMGTHDCCHASACQCHCVYTPAAMALPALANNVTSDSIPSLASAQFVAPRIHEFLRPPIA